VFTLIFFVMALVVFFVVVAGLSLRKFGIDMVITFVLATGDKGARDNVGPIILSHGVTDFALNDFGFDIVVTLGLVVLAAGIGVDNVAALVVDFAIEFDIVVTFAPV